MEEVSNVGVCEVATGQTIPPKHKERKIRTRRQRRMTFYMLFWILPIIHFGIFYVAVNASYFAMAFQKYSYATDGSVGFVVAFAGIDNFKHVISMFAQDVNKEMLLNSLIVYGVDFLCGTVVAILFSFYIYKKYVGAEFFRVILFLPQVLSSVVLTMLFQNICNYVLEVQVKFNTVLLYLVWTSFGVNILMYTGAMSGINEAISESCQLDGAGAFQELWYVTIPMIFPTIITFIVLGISKFFTNQAGLYTFFRDSSEYQTVGYYMYIQTLKSDLVALESTTRDYLSYPEVSAMGLVITAIVLPITLFVRRMLEKHGPRVD